MTLLLLIRHGENDFSKKGKFAGRMPGVHLNERGLKQAESLGTALREAPLKAVYSSPLERALETAAPIARAHGLQVVQDAGLLESDVGKWEGLSVGRVARTKYWKVVQNAPSRAGHPGGETFVQTQTRIVGALNAICARHKPQDVVACVFHADPIKMAVAYYLGLPLDNFQKLACDTGSLTVLAVHEMGAYLLRLNQRPPFEMKFPGKKK